MTIALDGEPLVHAPHTGIARYTRELLAALRVAHPDVQFKLESRPERAGLLEGRWWSIGLPRRLRETGAALFHGTDFAVPLLGKTPSVVTVHDLSPLRAREWHMPSTASRVAQRLPGAIARSRAVITPSERVKAEIVGRFSTPPEKIFVTPLAPAATFQPKPNQVSQPYILYVGSGQERKNLAGLLRVFGKLRKDLGVELVCIGKDLPFALQLAVRTPGVRSMESITDEELARLYSGASVFVYPSFYEGFGLPVVEAMACGAPVVVWRGTVCSDVAAGAAMEASSEEELEAAIRAVILQPELAADLRKRSLARALCYSWTATAKKTWEAYESALLAPESPYPAHGGGPMRSACVLEWLAQHAEVDALVCPEPGTEAGERLFDICRRVEVVRLPFHSHAFAPRAWRNLRRAVRRVPPLVDRFFCPEVGDALERLLLNGPYDLAVCEHFWMAPWIHTIRSHATTIILDQHNREPDFYRAVGGPLSGWFAHCAERWERDLLPEFDQVWDPVTVPTGLPWRDPSTAAKDAARDFDIAFSASWDYPPNRYGLIWFFKKVWPEILACRPGTTLALIGRHSEAIPGYVRKDRQVTITGPVVDATAWLERAKVAVAPLTRGAGVCVKVVEAWRAGCAVVATSLGARGYEAGEGLIMIDAPSPFATTVLQLLLDDSRRQSLARAGRRRFEHEYAWTAVRARMDRQIVSTLALEVMR